MAQVWYSATTKGTTDPGPPISIGYCYLENPAANTFPIWLYEVWIGIGQLSELAFYYSKPNGAPAGDTDFMAGRPMIVGTGAPPSSTVKAYGGTSSTITSSVPNVPFFIYQFDSRFDTLAGKFNAGGNPLVLRFPTEGIRLLPGGVVSIQHEEGVLVDDLFATFIFYHEG